jgi:hypothetical protein
MPQALLISRRQALLSALSKKKCNFRAVLRSPLIGPPLSKNVFVEIFFYEEIVEISFLHHPTSPISRR